jgi:hypothetical protein
MSSTTKPSYPPPKPKSEKKLTYGASPPLSNTSFSSVIYGLVFVLSIFTAFKTYNYASSVKQSFFPSSSSSPSTSSGSVHTTEVPAGAGAKVPREEVKEKLEDLAKALGMGTRDLVKAIKTYQVASVDNLGEVPEGAAQEGEANPGIWDSFVGLDDSP